jgi:hypothetical protein
MQKIKQNCIISSAAYSVPNSLIKQYDDETQKTPEIGDLIFGEITELGHHSSLESKSARIHTIHEGTRAVFVVGNRYAPDQFEGLVPEACTETIDMMSTGGVVAELKTKNEFIRTPTKIKILGYVCDTKGNIVNTRHHILVKPKTSTRKSKGAKLILCVGTAMNSGKTHAAAACCYALSSMGKTVRAAKITGTARLKDIFLMNDCGAEYVADFTYFGYPSTYMLNEEELLNIFHNFDMKYGNDPKNYLVIEIADGIFQRETAMLLRMEQLRERIHKLMFCAPDSSAVFGGTRMLLEQFDLKPSAISGICSSSPLAIREIETFTKLPVLRSMELDYNEIYEMVK